MEGVRFFCLHMPCLQSECQLGPPVGPMQNLQQVDLLWSTGECSPAVGGVGIFVCICHV